MIHLLTSLASCGMVQLFEELMELNGQPQFNMISETEFQESLSLDELRAMQNDPKYWKEKDPVLHCQGSCRV